MFCGNKAREARLRRFGRVQGIDTLEVADKKKSKDESQEEKETQVGIDRTAFSQKMRRTWKASKEFQTPAFVCKFMILRILWLLHTVSTRS